VVLRGGAAFNWVARGRDSYRIDSLEDRFNRKMADGKSMAGVEAKANHEERLISMMAEAAAILKQNPGVSKVDLAATLGLKYPDVIARHGKKLMQQFGD